MNSHQTNVGLETVLQLQQAQRRHRAAALAMLHVQYDGLCARSREMDAELERTVLQLDKCATEACVDAPPLEVLQAYRQRLRDMRPRVEQNRTALARRRHAQQRQLLAANIWVETLNHRPQANQQANDQVRTAEPELPTLCDAISTSVPQPT